MCTRGVRVSAQPAWDETANKTDSFYMRLTAQQKAQLQRLAEQKGEAGGPGSRWLRKQVDRNGDLSELRCEDGGRLEMVLRTTIIDWADPNTRLVEIARRLYDLVHQADLEA